MHPCCKRCPSHTYSISFWPLQLKAFLSSCCSLSNILFITKAFLPIAHKLRTHCAFKNRNCCQQMHFPIALLRFFFPSGANIELWAVATQMQRKERKIINYFTKYHCRGDSCVKNMAWILCENFFQEKKREIHSHSFPSHFRKSFPFGVPKRLLTKIMRGFVQVNPKCWLKNLHMARHL